MSIIAGLITEWDLDITDIREQYPPPLSKTLEIAEEFGVKHPRNPRSGDFVVMTTDFVVTKKQVIGITDYACAVKPSGPTIYKNSGKA